ncbi:MAG TPA: hypothetical protein VLU46_11915, partial [Thermoanaerobaculia bacterium]|nr:hypothetical protein [Thermoanaerobaculia bacterium]
ARREWLIGLVIAGGAALLLAFLPRLPRRVWLLLGFTLVVIDLVPLANELAPRMPAEFFTPPNVVAALQSDRSAHALMNRADWRNYERNFKDIRGELGPWFARNALQPFTPAAWGLRSALEVDFDETDLLVTHDLLNVMMKRGNGGDTHWAEEFAMMSNVDTIADLLPIAAVFQQPHDLERVRIIRFTRLPATGRYYFPQQNGRVTHVDERANGATIDVDAAANAPLFIVITRHKYWSATIDGREATLQPANIAYQSVVVPAGRHRVELRYRNPLVMPSGAVSGVAVAACLAAIVTAPIRRRRRLRSGS